jgi:CubicO group peptidase (beta-lactamase class C family)
MFAINCRIYFQTNTRIIYDRHLLEYIGLCWAIDPENSFVKNETEGAFGHSGFTGTSISVIPENNAFVILLINRQNNGLL